VLVRDVMSRPVVTVVPYASVRAAAAVLTDRGFTALPVVDHDGQLVGIVTEADLLRKRVRHDARSPLFGAELAAGAPPSRVADVMTVDVFTARPLTDVADLVDQMRAHGIRSVPIVDDGGAVVGIVSRRDGLDTTPEPTRRSQPTCGTDWRPTQGSAAGRCR
jgi:CBS-domain-containing membrane protein